MLSTFLQHNMTVNYTKHCLDTVLAILNSTMREGKVMDHVRSADIHNRIFKPVVNVGSPIVDD